MDFTPGLTTIEERALTTLQEEEDDNYEGVKKRLFDCDLETPVVKTKKQPVLVYLRIRPKSQLELLKKDPDCLHVSGEQELLAVAPRSSQTYKNKLGARCLQEGTQKFTFTRIFPPPTTQKELFDESLRSTLKDFFDGQNCLLFTYGVTNSGKTYTVTGTPSDPGILPRSLDVIFNSIDQQQLSNVSVKPKHFSELIHLSKEEASEMKMHRENILNIAREMMNPSHLLQHQQTITEGVGDEMELIGEHDISSVSTISKASSDFTDIDGGSFAEFQHDESSIELDCAENQQFSIWVSFAEIYNEFIYDLLSEPPAKGKQRTALKISEDRNKNHFIKGLQEIQVSSVEEAMLLLRLGLQHRHVAHTKLNYNSSRSHSIYTIKLVKLVNVDKPTRALVNRISIVDLAGAERSAKTGASGVRIKEAGNINNSLLTLGKCIEAMRHNQSKRGTEERVVPFRESKLTRLFQNYFVGTGKGKSLRQGKITMFVNVSNNASVFDETIHVLKFSALTSKIIPTTKVLHGIHLVSTSMCPPPTPHQPPTLTAAAVQGNTDARKPHNTENEDTDAANLSWEMEENVPPVGANTADCANCKLLSDQLAQCKEEAMTKVNELQVKLIEMEYNVRKEVSQEFAEQLTEIEDKHMRELEEQAEEYEEMYEKRFKLLQQSVKKATSRKRRRQDDDDVDVNDQSLKTEVANLKEKIQELEEELSMERNRAAAEIHDAMESYESKVVRLNKQLADMAVQLSSKEKDFSTERQTFKGQLEAAETRVAELSSEGEGERKKSKSQSQEYEDTILHLKQQCSELQREVEVARNAQTDSIFLQKGQNDKAADLLRESDKLRKQLSAAERENSDLAQKASDALAEEEILQARISELTAENATIQAEKCDLFSKIEELTAQKTATESINAELMQEKQLSEHQKETELTAMKVQAESHGQGIREMEDKLTALRKELDSARVQISELTSENTAMEAVKCDLLGKIDELAAQKTATESINAELVQEKQSSDYKKETELIAMRAQAETHSQEIHEMEEKLMALSEELDGAKARISELTSKNAVIEAVKCDLEAKLEELITKKENVKLEEEKIHQKDTELATLRETLENRGKKIHELEDKCMMLRDELNSSLAKLAVKQEAMYKLEEAKENLEKEVISLQVELDAKSAEAVSLASKVSELNEKNSLYETFRKTLKEYETTLEKQSSYIHEVEEDKESLHSQNYELDLKVTEMERQLAKASSSRDGLTTRIQELTQALEDSRQALSQREKELVDSADKCRETMENQMTDLRKQCSTLEQEIASAREDNKALQQQLRDKESELLALAKSVSREKTVLDSVTHELEEARQLAEQRQFQLEAMQGNHQLEVAQLSIKLREVTAELEEVQFACSQHHLIPGSNTSSSEGESSKSGTTPEEHIYEEPPEEMQSTGDPEDPVYDTVEDMHIGTPLASVENRPPKARRSYLQAVEGHEDKSKVKKELDQSKPYIPVLERSSQLIEESILDEETKLEIDATPLPLRKKARKLKAKAEKAARKRSIEEVDKENDHQQGSPLRKKPPQRTRHKPQRYEEETTSLENFTPTSQKNHKQRTLRQRILGTGKSTAKKIKATTVASEPQENVGTDCIASRTRQRRAVVTKAQISGPLELQDSPNLNGRNMIDIKGAIPLGSRMRPVTDN